MSRDYCHGHFVNHKMFIAVLAMYDIAQTVVVVVVALN